MRALLDWCFGKGATLKRETVIVCWAIMLIMVVRVFVYVAPGDVKNFEFMISGILWPIVALLAAIFGIQLAPQIGSGSTTKVTKIMRGEGDDQQQVQQVVEKTTTSAAPNPDAGNTPPKDFAG